MANRPTKNAILPGSILQSRLKSGPAGESPSESGMIEGGPETRPGPKSSMTRSPGRRANAAEAAKWVLAKAESFRRADGDAVIGRDQLSRTILSLVVVPIVLPDQWDDLSAAV